MCGWNASLSIQLISDFVSGQVAQVAENSSLSQLEIRQWTVTVGVDSGFITMSDLFHCHFMVCCCTSSNQLQVTLPSASHTVLLFFIQTCTKHSADRHTCKYSSVLQNWAPFVFHTITLTTVDSLSKKQSNSKSISALSWNYAIVTTRANLGCASEWYCLPS